MSASTPGLRVKKSLRPWSKLTAGRCAPSRRDKTRSRHCLRSCRAVLIASCASAQPRVAIFARQQQLNPYADTLLNQLGLAGVERHPGYQLVVQTLGSFRAWRGSSEITADAWRRKKARQLFLYLLTMRSGKVERDQIIEALWPELGPEEAQRDFKIVLWRDLNAGLEWVIQDLPIGERFAQ